MSSPPVRREINDLIADSISWSLYCQALNQLKSVAQSDSRSFFQIAGIHGLPPVRWENSGNATSTGSWTGYCTHGMVTFPTWHRPYVLLYETLIRQYAVAIASTAPTAWQTAANNLRQPYWDWASKPIPPPEVTTYQNITIVMPNGSNQVIQNPLYGYIFNPVDPSFPSQYQPWWYTQRHPTSSGSGSTHNVNDMLGQLQANYANVKSNTYNLLLNITSWAAFSNHTASPGGSSSSLESIHDGLHLAIGGTGHMAAPEVAAMDPIFFLHHANCDRLFAMWQAINWNTWVSSGQAQQGGSWTISNNQTVNSTTALAPFRTGFVQSNPYTTSDGCRNWQTYGNYTYPEFVGLDPTNSRNQIIAAVNTLYGPGSPLRVGLSEAGENTDSSSVSVADNNGYYEWSLRTHCEQYTVLGSFNICAFIVKEGQSLPEDGEPWYKSETFVGQLGIFAPGPQSTQYCSNCQQQAKDGTINEGFIPLTPWLNENSGLPSTKPDDVVPYLKKNLEWRAYTLDYKVIPLANLPSFKVTVFSSYVIPPKDHDNKKPPEWGPHYEHPEVTHGKRGGAD